MSVAPLAITIVNLPYGQVGSWYSAGLCNNGSGLLPLTWSLIGGSLPAGLQMNPQGQIFGTSTAVALNTALLVSVQDSSLSPPQQASALVGLNIGVPPPPDPGNIYAKFHNSDF
jgi:hypothetical protein